MEKTSGLVLEYWQKIICDRLEAMTHQEGQRLLVHGPPQFGKPAWVEALVLMADGTYKRLGDVVVGDCVITHRGHAQGVLNVFIQGELECVEVATKHGRRTTAALDHPFLTPEGWIEAGKLQIGQALANVPRPDCIQTVEIADDDFIMAGYFIGDGCVAPIGKRFQASLTSADAEQAADVTAVAERLGFRVRSSIKPNGRFVTLHFSNGEEQDWLRRTGVGGHKALTKTVPDWVYRGTDDQVGLFLGAYFSCDGNVNGKGLDRHGKSRPDATCEFYSISPELLKGVQRLLLRVGVQSTLAVKNGLYRGDRHKSWRLYFTKQDDVAQFFRLVPVPGLKGHQLKALKTCRTSFMPSLFGDSIVSVTPVGLRECRCLAVAEDHTFTIDDIVVHNSLIISQRFPVYDIGINPAHRVRVACYNVHHAERFSKVNLELMRAPAYQEFFPNPGTRVPAITSSAEWSTASRAGFFDANPSFKALGLGTGFTGIGVDTLIIDDPYKDRIEARSEATNKMLWGWWNDIVIPRMNPATNVVVMFHRWWDGDFAGKLLEQKGWESMRFPAIGDGGADDPTGRGVGELLSPRYTLPYLENIRSNKGTSFDALYQGTPYPATGSMFKAGKVGWVKAVPNEARRVRKWDVASTSGGGDYSVGVLMARAGNRYYVEDLVYGQWEGTERDEIILETARRDDKRYRGAVLTLVPQDPGSAGKDMAAAFVRLLAGFAVRVVAETGRVGDKEARADPFASQWNAGDGQNVWNVALLEDTLDNPWNDWYLSCMTAFPFGKVDDPVDASSGAFKWLAGKLEAIVEAVSFGPLHAANLSIEERLHLLRQQQQQAADNAFAEHEAARTGIPRTVDPEETDEDDGAVVGSAGTPGESDLVNDLLNRIRFGGSYT